MVKYLLGILTGIILMFALLGMMLLVGRLVHHRRRSLRRSGRGAAGSTGRGEENIRIAGAHTVVENIRHGMSPKEVSRAVAN